MDQTVTIGPAWIGRKIAAWMLAAWINPERRLEEGRAEIIRQVNELRNTK